VPYISSAIVGPVVLVVILFGAVYLHGVNVLNEEAKGTTVRVSGDKMEAESKEDKYSATDSSMLTNGEVYLKGVGIFKNLFTFETKSDTLTYNFKTPSVTSK